jgi:murein DD-endopeptidase MepM/ murein hydrolase activator NlpD
VVSDPVSEIIKRGTKIIPYLGTGAFGWPVHNPVVTSGYGMRWGSFHKGIDIISKTGDLNIVAADNGKVTYAQFNSGGYGNCVLIDHHNGYVTRYAHLRTIQVKVGQTVEKGQVLGIMGETGDAEGIHLHFEVIKNGNLKNPMGFLNK